MKYQDLIAQLQSNPNASNVSAVQAWLTKRQKSSKSVDEVVYALVQSKPDPDTYEWLQRWLETRAWYSLDHLVHIKDAEWHAWLIQFASAHPLNQHTGSLWLSLLMSYKYKPLIENASEWLVKYGQGKEASMVAGQLMSMTKDTKTQEKAIALLREFPDEFTIASLIEHTGDPEAVALGHQVMNDAPNDLSQFVAEALLKNSASKNWPAIERWLGSRWQGRNTLHNLQYLMPSSPLTVAPLAFEWIDDHPRAKNVAQTFRTALALNPSQELIDLIWKWLETRSQRNDYPEILQQLFHHFGQLKTPPGAILLADKWLNDNLHHELFVSILLGVIREESTDLRVTLARRWLTDQRDADKGHMLMNLRRRCSNTFTDEAMDWAVRHPNQTEAHVIKYEYLRDNRNTDQVTVDEIKQFVSHHLFSEHRLCALIRAQDAEAIASAKSLLAAPQVELKYSESARCRQVPLLAALFEAVPNDVEVLGMVDQWFESDDEVCAEHLEQMQEAKNKLLNCDR